MIAPEFFSCDWGTSSFRIRWVREGRVVQEHRDETGCRALFERSDRSNRATLYGEFLRQQLDRWHPEAGELPLVISGMASSTIGWRELPYALAPLKLDGSSLGFEMLSWDKPPWLGKTYLISGLATEDEIMRGEEIEAIGLLNGLPVREKRLLVLPGTHSKHLLVENGEIRTFTTFMTGELFEVLARHSILRATVDLLSIKHEEFENLAAFDAGVRQAAQAGLPASLFQTRARAVLKASSAAENSWFLSGVLIGAELSSGTVQLGGNSIVIGGARSLRSLYARALGNLGTSSKSEEVTDELIEMAVPLGHAIFLEGQGAWALNSIMECPLIGILRGFDSVHLPEIMSAAGRGGLRNVEITMNSPSATEQIREVSRGISMNVGAGTVATVELLEEALRAGARFIVTPAVNKRVIQECARRAIPVFPGTFSPTEIYEAWELGATMVKVFPADALGPAYVRALLGPFPKIRLLPTGGIDLESGAAFLKAGATGLGVGGPLFDKKRIDAGDWNWLEEQTRRFVSLFQ